jgi:hypothetical protein
VAASLDRGGHDPVTTRGLDWDNVQTAHFLCNVKKGAVKSPDVV